MPNIIKIGGKKFEVRHRLSLIIKEVNIKDLTKLNKFSSIIKTLRVVDSTIESLNGLEKLPNLFRFEAWRSSINDISALSSCNKLTSLALRELDLRGKKIFDLDHLGDLPNLLGLTITNNKIKKISNLGRFKFLKNFIIGTSQISKIEGLENCVNLEKLGLYRSQITKIEGLKNCKNLKKLFLENNQITKIEGLENCINLETLFLSSNQIAKIEGLENCVNLKDWRLLDNQITKIEGLENCENLETLFLSSNQITKIEGLENCVNLTKLILSQNQISKIEDLGELKNIKELSLAENRITSITGLENLTNLEILNLANNQITDIGVLSKLNAPNLREIDLSNNLIRDVKVLGEFYAKVSIKLKGNPLSEEKVISAGAEPLNCLYCNFKFFPIEDCEISCQKELNNLIRDYNLKIPKYGKGKLKMEHDGYVYDSRGGQVKLYSYSREKVQVYYKLSNSKGLRGPLCENCKNKFLEQVEKIYKQIKTSGSRKKIVSSIHKAVISEISLENAWWAKRIKQA